MRHDNTRILWLNGAAGSGKSAILQTVAEQYATNKTLAANFFFYRGADHRSVFDKFIRTLVYDLVLRLPFTKPSVIRVIMSEPSIFTRSPWSDQFQRLFLEPLMAGKKSFFPFLLKPAIIIVDALDECKDENSILEFIDVLVRIFRSNSRLPLRVIVASRDVEHIGERLDTDVARSVTRHLSLQKSDTNIAIRKFFQNQFNDFQYYRIMRHVPQPWPLESELDTLVQMCNGSFHSAVAIVQFIDTTVPQYALRAALSGGLDLITSSAPRLNPE